MWGRRIPRGFERRKTHSDRVEIAVPVPARPSSLDQASRGACIELRLLLKARAGKAAPANR